MRTLIRGGRVIDPANRVDAVMDILCEDGKVALAGKDLPAAECTIDAAGRVVCPGFIDIHMHEDPVGAGGEIAVSIFDCMLRMGVTTCVAGNCGTNVYDPVGYLEKCDKGVPCNVAMLAGHSWAREQAGVEDRYASATEEQKRREEALLSGCLEAGCCGISFGLRYVPGTDRNEFHRAAAVCRDTGKPITAHVRDDADYIFSAIDEMTEAAEQFGLPLQISHIGSMAGFGQMAEVLRRLDIRRMNGLDVTLDCYPYDAFCTELGATTYDDGWLERYRCGYDALEYCEGEWAGKRADAESFRKLRAQRPEMLTVCHVMRPDEIALALKHPAVMIGSDGILNDGQGHPRAAGTFPRVFAEYVKKGSLTLNEAIAKMTSLPAGRMGFAKKGSLGRGMDADIVAFDPQVIRDRATFAHPTDAPEGIQAVLVGGVPAVLDGKIVNGRLGRAVRT